MIFLIWAEKGEYSDKQHKIMGYAKTRVDAEETARILNAVEPKSRGRWDDTWVYSVGECEPITLTTDQIPW